MSKKKIVVIVCAIVAVLTLVGVVVAVNHSKNGEMSADNNEVVPGHENDMKSFLTGEWVDKKIGTQRPIAVMNGNTKEALPQYGINSAGVIYEAPVEGRITRLMAIFEDYDDLDHIGPVRSSRDYYVYEAMAYDSIYVN